MDELRTMLLVILALPLAAAVVVALLGPSRGPLARWLSLGVVLVNLLLTGFLASSAARVLADRPMPNPAAARKPTFQPEAVPGDPGSGYTDAHTTTWDVLPLTISPVPGKPAAAVQFFIGLDGLNLWLVALTSVLMLPAVLTSWGRIKERENEYYAWLLVLQTGTIGVFVSFDLILFYVFFELTLIPMFFLIGVWGGGPNRREAARKFFLYTLAGSLITLVGMMYLVLACYTKSQELTFSIPRLFQIIQERVPIDGLSYWRDVEFYAFVALAAGFLVKVPLVPFHSWLPLAYAESPTPVTMLLSGLLAKMGTYGLLRMCIPLVPDAALQYGLPVVGGLAALGIVYAALAAFAQNDLKRMLAYSSVSHLGFCVLGLFALDQAGMAGGALHMVNHALSTGALFLLAGMVYERYHTRNISDLGGIAARVPLLAVFMMAFTLASVGLPALNNFVSEMLMLAGLVEVRSPDRSGLALALVAALGIVLGAWYMMTMMMRVFFGPLREPAGVRPNEPPPDLTATDLLALVPVLALCVLLGVAPQLLLDTMNRDVAVIAQALDAARARAGVP
jgi:NADH-quinone oxidoreductase subunit M